MEQITKAIGAFILGIILIVGLSLLMAFPTMWLWNWLMPAIFGVIKISFWKALGINIFSGILFGRGSSNSSKS